MFGYWQWKAIDLHFSAYYNITSFPVKWNSKTKLLTFDFKNPSDYYPWIFNFFFAFGLVSLSSLSYVCLLKTNVPLFLIWTYRLMIFLVFTALGVIIYILAFGQAQVNCLNCVIQIHNELTLLQQYKVESSRRKEIKAAKKGRIGYLIFLAEDRLVYLIVICCVFGPVFVIFFAESVNINPLAMTIIDILENRCEVELSFISLIAIRIICAIFLADWFCEGIRVVPTFLVFVFIPAQIWVYNNSLMKTYFMHNLNQYECLRKVYMAHKKLTITQTVAAEFVEPESFLISKVMIRLVPLFLFFCIRMPNVFPVQMYIPFVLSTPLIVVGVVYMAMLVAKIYTESVDAIKSYKKSIFSKKKELLQMFKTLRPLGFRNGIAGFHFEVLDDHCMKRMLKGVVDKTIELLIVFPEGAFK